MLRRTISRMVPGGGEKAERAGLDEERAERGRLGWSCHDAAAAGVGGQLVQEGVSRPAADDVERLDRPGQRLEFAQGAGGARGEALENEPDQLAAGRRLGHAGVPARRPEERRHVGSSSERGRIEVERAAERRRRLRFSDERLDVDLLPRFGPRADALLEDPHPRPVLEEADRPVEAGFVGEAGEARRLREDGRLELGPEERPRAGAEVRPRGVLGRDGGHGRCGVVRASRNHERRVLEDDAVRQGALEQRPQDGSWSHDGRPLRRVQPEGLHQLSVPLAGGGIEQVGRAGHRALGDGASAEVEQQRLGDEQPLGGCGNHVGLAGGVGEDLEEGVELEHLEARAGEKRLGRDGLEGSSGPALRAPVAVGIGVAEQPPVGAERHVVHGPGVDRDGFQLGRCGERGGEAGLDVPPDRLEVPEQVTVALDEWRRKTVDLPRRHAAGRDRPEDGPAAGGAEVDGEHRGARGSRGSRTGRHQRLCGGT